MFARISTANFTWKPVASTALTITAVIGLAACNGAPSASNNATTAPGYPVTVTSCGVTTKVTAPPKRMVTLNQGATQVALALGLQKDMAGTAYLDDSIPAQWQAAYKTVPVLATEYPSKEKFLAAKPDFAYGSYASAFADKSVGSQAELAKLGVQSYLSPFGCTEAGPKKPATWDAAWSEVRDIAKVFGVTATSDQLIGNQQRQLKQIEDAHAGKGLKVLWYDSDTKTPFVGAGQGGPQLIMNAVGATNVFASMPSGWSSVSWEKFVASNPDVIVIIDASWDTAASKIAYLKSDPVLSKLTAVQKSRFVVIPFSESTPSILLADGAATVSAGVEKLHITH